MSWHSAGSVPDSMVWLKERFRELRVLARQGLGIEPRIRRGMWPPLEYHGNSDGGWNIVAGSLSRDSVVVDVGLGEDASFSESIIRKYGCLVHGFDPTPRAIQYVQSLGNEHLRLFELGLGAAAGAAPFFLPNNSAHVSGSVSRERHLGRQCITVQLVTIGQIFELLGCERIHLLKLDIEGTEYDVIQAPEFHEHASAIDQLCVEFHHRWEGRGKASTETAVNVLRSLGFECAWSCRTTNEEFLFVRRSCKALR